MSTKPPAPKIKWTEALLQKTFRLNKVQEHFPLLDAWLQVSGTFAPAEEELLNNLREELLKNYIGWNEEELKMYFIAHILRLVNYQTDTIRGFLEREISAVIDEIPLKVKADLLIAQGFGDLMEAPYFCFHEYKRSKRNPDEPEAQVLAAMLIAEALNANDKPIYGCYVIGHTWYFMVMHQRTYGISRLLDATDPAEIRQIVLVLKHFKEILQKDLLAAAR